MARKRMIDPEFWSDEQIGSWSFAARLLYIGLWNFADDEARFKANAKLLKSQIFPYDERVDIEVLKKELGDKVLWYEVGGLQYGLICNFFKHQRIDHPTKSVLPEPPKDPGTLAESSPSVQGDIPSNVPLIEVNLREVNIKEPMSGKPDLAAPILYLNEKAGTHYKPNTKSHQAFIKARYREGHTLDDFKKVIDRKCAEWLTDEKMIQYLRPETLFNATKFDSYLNQPALKEKTGIHSYLEGPKSKSEGKFNHGR